jgi:molybdenum cofactor cytidylyltransferase
MLAAGNSRRFGSNKLLYEIEGRPMYQYAFAMLKGVRERLREQGIACSFQVVTQYAEIVEYVTEKSVQVLINPYPQYGISSSLKIGLKANLDADACLFTVSDQPWLKEDTVVNLIWQFLSSDKKIACLAEGEKLGNPCIFARDYYPELLALQGDTGGKRVIQAHLDDTLRIEAGEKRQLEDIDYLNFHN